jgi:hypothetical protein
MLATAAEVWEGSTASGTCNLHSTRRALVSLMAAPYAAQNICASIGDVGGLHCLCGPAATQETTHTSVTQQ